MIQYSDTPVIISGGTPVESPVVPRDGREKTMAYAILRAHDQGGDRMRIRFDAMVSHDITYVGVIQTARASGMKEFPIPYALTNCHNSLCAVGGTINEDDHAFGLSAAMKYGGIYVPANLAVIHQYARERLAACGKMILGSDSHTRYGCFGTMGVGEGGGELAKQLLRNTWDVEPPQVVLVWLTGKPRRGVGPHDVAIALVAETFPEGRVKNKVLEFAGPGIKYLSMDYRAGVDVMTTETSCLSSIWETDETVRAYYEMVGRPEAFSELRIQDGAAYDGMVTVELDKVECMAALPFHPSKAVTIHELQQKPELLSELTQGTGRPEQGVIVGCAGGMYENIVEAAAILEGGSVGNGYFDLSVYPSSAPVATAIASDGTAAKLLRFGAVVKPAFCGPCFGAGDCPANATLSLRHATRNFPNREGSKPASGQSAFVALMDARSIAATARNGGVITAATDVDYEVPEFHYSFDDSAYKTRVYEGFGHPKPETELRFGPNITDWPKMPALEDDLLVRLCAVIHDEVTTTDELIPSGETSSYRSNPVGLAEFTLSRREPEYVGRAKAVREIEVQRQAGTLPEDAAQALALVGGDAQKTSIGSCIFARKPGDGSAREQAASCQKVLGGLANLCFEFATKRYRSNCINWGIVPFTIPAEDGFAGEVGDWVYVPGVRAAILSGQSQIPAKLVRDGRAVDITLSCGELSADEREILTDGCLMNYYARRNGEK